MKKLAILSILLSIVFLTACSNSRISNGEILLEDNIKLGMKVYEIPEERIIPTDSDRATYGTSVEFAGVSFKPRYDFRDKITINYILYESKADKETSEKILGYFIDAFGEPKYTEQKDSSTYAKWGVWTAGSYRLVVAIEKDGNIGFIHELKR